MNLPWRLFDGVAKATTLSVLLVFANIVFAQENTQGSMANEERQPADGLVATDVLEDLLLDNPEACQSGPLKQFGRYIGDWDVADQTASADGKTWSAGYGARWKFTCVGGGLAIQDFWVPNGPDGEPFLSGFSTNFRTYDPVANIWNVVWAGRDGPSFTHIRGSKKDRGDIVMHWVSPVQEPPRRITFFAPTKEGWDWLLEMSFDAGETWQEVYKIRASLRR